MNSLVVDEFDVNVSGTTMATMIPATTKPMAAKNAPIDPIETKPILAKNAPIVPKPLAAEPTAPAKTAGFLSLVFIRKKNQFGFNYFQIKLVYTYTIV